MKKVMLLLLIISLTIIPVFATGEAEMAKEKTVLTLGSWRTDDVEQINALLAEYAKLVPDVEIQFKPTNPPDYNATLRLQLDSNTGPDLMYARSYATGQELFNAGYFEDCTNIPGLMENFTPSSLAPWQMPDGKMFAVPFAAVSHVVYYNKAIFKKVGLTIPETWEDFLSLCAKLQNAGYTPLANGLADEWDIFECFFCGILPNFIGGAAEREKYETGEKPLNDSNMVEAYQAMADVAKYCPSGFEAVTYNDSQVLFNTEKAVMFMDGSWTLGVYSDDELDWGVFAMPAPKGKNTAICFHPDTAITMNTATKHPEEAKAFLAWLCTKEGATIASNKLPTGFFPMINASITISNAHANECLALNNGKETDARFVWPALMDLYSPMDQAVIKVMKGELTAKQAADQIAALKK